MQTIHKKHCHKEVVILTTPVKITKTFENIKLSMSEIKSNSLMQVGNNYSEFNYTPTNSLTQDKRNLEPLKWRRVSEECLDIASGKTGNLLPTKHGKLRDCKYTGAGKEGEIMCHNTNIFNP